MPRAGDAFLTGQLPATHSPLDRIAYTPPKNTLTFDDILDQVEEWVSTYIFPAIKDLTGIDFSSWTAFFQSIKDETGIDLTLLGTLLDGFDDSITSLFGAFNGIDLTDPGSILTVIGNLLGIDTSGGAPTLDTIFQTGLQLLFGQVPGSRLGGLPIGQLSSAQPNLLTAGGFPNPASITDNTVWTFDAAVSHTGDGTGSARTTADGTLKVLRSNTIEAHDGDQLSLSAWVKWSALVSTGTPLKLGIRTFLGTATVADVTIASVPSPGSSGGFTQLSGTYTIPSGVDSYYTRLIVDTTATAGTVWYDDSAAKKTGLIQMPWVQDLIQRWQQTAALFGITDTDLDGDVDINDIWTAIVNSILHPLNLLFHQSDPIPDASVPGINSILSSLFGGFMQLPGISGASQTQALQAITGQAQTTMGTNATVAQILAALGPGNVAADDFERTSTSNLDTTKWSIYQTGTGTLATPDGHNASFTGTADAEFVARWLGNHAASDNQVTSVVLSSAAGFAPFIFPTDYGCNDLWLRMTAFTTWATRTGLRLRWQSVGTLRLDWFTAGTMTNLVAAFTVPNPPAGAILSFEAGQGLTPRRFIAKVNNQPIMDFTESGSTSQYGLTYRERGMGGRTENGLLGTAYPGAMKQWTAQG